MSKLILYLLEASASLAVLYALYLLVLRKLTFFSFNRFFLLAILVVSLALPLLSFELFPSADHVVTKPVAELREMRLAYYQALDDWVFERRSTTELTGANSNFMGSSEMDWKKGLLFTLFGLYLCGIIVLLSRTLWTYTWMRRLKSKHPSEVIDGVLVVKVPYPMAPFSFMNAVFVFEETLQDESFLQILAHEKTHIKQRHSIDLIFVQLIVAIHWFNPAVWHLIKSLKTTHEYIVDKQMINQGYSLVEYQTLLLRQLISNNSYGLVHNFNLSFIKKRITMMKIKESGMAGKAKVAVVFAAVVVFSMVIVQCNSKLEESEVSLESPSLIAPPPPPINLPQVGDVGKFNPDLDLSNSIVFNIDNDVLHVNGKVCDLDDLAGVLNEFDSNERTIAVFFIHQDQTMRFVRDVQDVLRLENRLKVVYQAIDEQGKSVELPLLLSPHPDSPEGFKFPKITPEYASEYDIEAMFVHVEENGALNNAKKVNDMVQNHIKTSDDRFVVSIKSDDQDAYGDYFKNLFHIHQVFDKIYEQRAQEMFGVSFYDIDRKNSEGMEQYKAVREGIPRNISIAERD